jgi:hypothetical protein
MAITERYVTATAGGGGDGTSGNPWTLHEAIGAAVEGDRINIKAGTYSMSATEAPTANGSPSSPIIYRGYNSTIGDLDTQGRNSTGDLNTTNFPSIEFSSSYYWNAAGQGYTAYQNLIVKGSYSGPVLKTGASCVVQQVYCENSSTNANADGLQFGGSACTAINCDAKMTGASGARAAFSASFASDPRFLFCRVRSGSRNNGFYVTGSSPILVGCVVAAATGYGFYWPYTATTTAAPLLVNCTAYGCGGDAYRNGSYSYDRHAVLVNCHFTDNAGYAANNEYSGTETIAIWMAFNRTRDNTSGVSVGFTDWAAASTIGHVTTDTGGASTDYKDAANGDLRLIAAAPGKAAGIVPYSDIGGLQRQEPTLPAVGDVQSGVTYGEDGTGSTGTFGVPAVGDVKSGVQYGAGGTEFTGTYSAGASSNPRFSDRSGGK